MDTRTLEQAFNAKFHDTLGYNEFCSLDIENEITNLEIGLRDVFKTSPKLKDYLRFIDKVIFEHLQKHTNAAHAYVKEKSALTAVSAHSENKFFFTTDIENFFPNITAEDINNLLIRDSLLVPISDFSEFIPKLVELTTYKGSIPIGFPTSPKLSNAFMFEFDTALYKYCSEQSLTYTRYSDDIIVSANSHKLLDELEVRIQELLCQYASPRLILKEDKTRKKHIGKRVKILGMVIMPNGNITIDSKYKKTLESLLHFYINDEERFKDLLKRELRGKKQSLFGLLHYAKSIDPDYIRKLQKKYGAYALSDLMEHKDFKEDE